MSPQTSNRPAAREIFIARTPKNCYKTTPKHGQDTISLVPGQPAPPQPQTGLPRPTRQDLGKLLKATPMARPTHDFLGNPASHTAAATDWPDLGRLAAMVQPPRGQRDALS